MVFAGQHGSGGGDGSGVVMSNGQPHRKADVLNDIGCMLQNLTDELDAMLCPATEQSR